MAAERRGRSLRDWVPRWWRGEAGLAGRVASGVLWPAEQLYRGAIRARNGAYGRGWLRSEAPPIPVVSIGNLAVGGTGKTPVSAWVAARLRAAGARPALVLRGYGEDEVLVHRELNPEIPVIVAARRIEGVEEAARAGAAVAVVDDGFQHRALRRQLDVVLVAAEGWRAAPRLLPRGPWREGTESLGRAHLAIVTRKTATGEQAKAVAAALSRWIDPARILRCHIAPTELVPLRGGEGEPLGRLAGHDVLAVASLADPRSFVAHLERAGARVELMAYPDHHAFTGTDAAEIRARAGRRPIVMTRKEAVKLRAVPGDWGAARVLEQRVEFEAGEEILERCMREAIGG
ncbi:MAG TPA: tetraacyldisaccharide 4'-kinase [Longimicrobiaceae bacterium]|nr:tetraacyldisaccharide 4'-kinase [Longimicrobiaceae bacterium]